MHLNKSDQLINAGSQKSQMRRPTTQHRKQQIKVEDLDINQVLDFPKAFKLLGGESLFNLMVPTYESTSLMPHITKLAHYAFPAKDWDQVKFVVHAIKGPASFIGASRLHYACYYIRKAHLDQDIDGIIDYYPFLIEAAIEVRYHVAHCLAKLQNRGNNISSIILK